MSLADLLQQIVGGASQPNASQLDQVTQSASKADLQGGVSAALRSDQTPDLSQIVSQMFGQASPEQQAAILNTITEKLGPGALAGVAGGVLAGHEGADTPQVSVAKAGTVTPDQVRDVVVSAQKQEPGLLDRIGGFYAEHPDLVKTLGAGALTIALAHMKNNLSRR